MRGLGLKWIDFVGITLAILVLCFVGLHAILRMVTKKMTRVRLYTLPIRVWHWINAFLIFFLIITGIQLRVPDVTIFAHYSQAVWLHKYAGFCMAGSFIFWLCYVLASGSFRQALPYASRGISGVW